MIFFRGTPNYTLSISHSPRPLTAGPIRNAEIIEPLLPVGQKEIENSKKDVNHSVVYWIHCSAAMLNFSTGKRINRFQPEIKQKQTGSLKLFYYVSMTSLFMRLKCYISITAGSDNTSNASRSDKYSLFLDSICNCCVWNMWLCNKYDRLGSNLK